MKEKERERMKEEEKEDDREGLRSVFIGRMIFPVPGLFHITM
jgi:hypothetical protein